MKNTTQRGFTLIETLVAITILTLAIAGPLTTASRALVAAEISRDQLTASYLAQQGLEYVRSVRDNQYLAAYQAGGTAISTVAWTNFLTAVSACQAGTCSYNPDPNPTSGPLAPCGGATACPYLYLQNGVYTLNAGSTNVTPFASTIQLTLTPLVGAVNEEQVVSTVSWNFHGVPYSISATDHLIPWQ